MTLRHRIRPLRARLVLLLAVLGPGIITANVDNDAGGITTYSVAGAHYGYSLLWIMPLLALALIIVQEMSARLGVVTGKGLADLIRESLGVRLTAIIIGIMVIANLANTVSEFAGVAASLEIFGVSKYIAVPIAAVLVWLLIVKANYKFVERIFLVASLIFLTYIISGVLAHPVWPEVGRALVTPTIQLNAGYMTMVVTIIGTTIAPWMQFYQQASIVDKGLKITDYAYERLDVIFGSLFAVIVASFIMIACAATLYQNNIRIDSASDAAQALRPLAGDYASLLFAFGLLNASVFSAAVLPLSTAYVVCEAFGWEQGVNRRFKDAPIFFSVYTALIVLGAAIILLPIESLIKAMLSSQTLNGVLLPIILIVMLKLINDRRLMGRFKNGRVFNLVAWITVLIVIGLTVILVAVSSSRQWRRTSSTCPTFNTSSQTARPSNPDQARCARYIQSSGRRRPALVDRRGAAPPPSTSLLPSVCRKPAAPAPAPLANRRLNHGWPWPRNERGHRQTDLRSRRASPTSQTAEVNVMPRPDRKRAELLRGDRAAPEFDPPGRTSFPLRRSDLQSRATNSTPPQNSSAPRHNRAAANIPHPAGQSFVLPQIDRAFHGMSSEPHSTGAPPLRSGAASAASGPVPVWHRPRRVDLECR